MARSTFYYQLKKSGQPDKDSLLGKSVASIYHRHKGRYGYGRITDALKNSGVQINHKRVARLMSECGLKSLVRIKKYKSYRGEQGKIARNLLYNGEIISYNLSQRPTFFQTMDMLDKALNKLPDNCRPILHSDQGWQYQMKEYRHKLRKRRIRQSMSGKGNCLDNAAMESFFAILKSEMFYLKKFTSIDSLRKDVEKYIHYYNNDRIKLKLNGLSPVQYRTQAA